MRTQMNQSKERRIARLELSSSETKTDDFRDLCKRLFPGDAPPTSERSAFVKLWKCISDGRGNELISSLGVDGE